MSYFYHPKFFLKGEDILLSREESQHLVKSFRAKVNDEITLLNGKGQYATAQIKSVPHNKGQVSCHISNTTQLEEPSHKISLYLAPPRHNILTGLMKQCVELGIWEIHFIECQYSVAKPKDKIKSIEKDLIAGVKQSGNAFFPSIHPLKSFNTALNECDSQIIIGAVPEDNFPVHKAQNHIKTSIWIGPEGGFSNKEKDLLKKANAEALCIGQWILRVETAVVGLSSILINQSNS